MSANQAKKLPRRGIRLNTRIPETIPADREPMPEPQVAAIPTKAPANGEDVLALAADPLAEQLANDKAIVEAAIAELATDPGAHLTEPVRRAWASVHQADLAAFERLRKQARDAGARVKEVDRIVGSSRARGFPRLNLAQSPSSSSVTRSESILSPSFDHPGPSESPSGDASPTGLVPPGSMVQETEDGPRRLIESEAALILAEHLRERLTWDADAQSWWLWANNHWAPQSTTTAADRLTADAIHTGTAGLGYRLSYLDGVVRIAQRRGLFEPFPVPSGLIPFPNGLLDPATGTLTPPTPRHAMTWVIPHDYSPTADCPTIRTWLLRSVEGDAETVELLRAWMAALLRGIEIQRFLLLIGRGGSGKGTFQRLVAALVGIANVAISALRDLEENRFETAKLYGKRLCMINEAGKHGGALNMLKAITGGDHIPLERKHQQQTGSFVFGGLVLMATNEDLRSTDTTSGLERRRITVRFPVSATPEEKADWESRGGEAAVLHPEIPGLVNWLLAMPVSDIRDRFERPPQRVITENLLGLKAGNSVADWMLSETVPEPRVWSQVGTKHECRNPDTGETYYRHAAEWLYPNYLTWCMEHARRPVAIQGFKTTIVDIAETLGHKLHAGRMPEGRASGIEGLRLRKAGDKPEEECGWIDRCPSGSGGSPEGHRMDNPLINMNRMDFGQKLSQDFPERARISL